jgi:hypothetical protein
MPQYTNSMRELSGAGNFESEIDKLFREMMAAATQGDDVSSHLTSANVTAQDYQYSDILKDRGAGRISSGLKSLDLLSILCSGATPSNLFLFDNVIYSGNVSQIKSATDSELIDIVIANLGMELIVFNLPDTTTFAFKAKCLNIGKDVKVGYFEISTYNTYILSETKRLTRIYLKGQQ